MLATLRGTAKSVLRRLISAVGGVVISQHTYRHILAHRANAIAELTNLENLDLKAGLTGVVFSKDRALQLYSLLHSYFELVENPVEMFIIYSASSDKHSKAYRDVIEALNNSSVAVTFVREAKSFRETVLEVLKQVKTKNIFFLVDDIIFIRPLNFQVAAVVNPLKSILSFRHSPHLRRSYTGNTRQMPPEFNSVHGNPELLEFKWFEQGSEWSDPWSFDGQVLSTAEVRVLTRLSDFKAPNTYEGALKQFNEITKDRSGLCFGESKILNLPINRVQSEVPNLSGNVSPEFLLEQWDKGLMLDTRKFNTHIPLSPHEEHSVSFIQRAFPSQS
jgi:hypothetical protein